jgi:hypothetical protein
VFDWVLLHCDDLGDFVLRSHYFDYGLLTFSSSYNVQSVHTEFAQKYINGCESMHAWFIQSICYLYVNPFTLKVNNYDHES